MNTLRQSTENKNRITALYERLSHDDEQEGTSNSIINQQKMLEDYAAANGFANLRHFSDDGWSGTRWDRPSWKELIAEVETGNVGAVIVKDMSRVGRDYLQVGFFTEVLLRKHNVRFIAVGNNIDSANKESAEFAPFLNLMSEFYARDTSRKTKAVAHSKGNSGKPMTNVPIYGYKRSLEDKDVWIVDDEAAAVVRRVFQLAMDGMGVYQIAQTFSQEKVERPSYYMVRNNMVGAPKATCDLSNPYGWSVKTVARILERPEYLGHVVNFRTFKDSYKDKHAKLNPKENWKIFENRHEPLVSQEVFDTVQKLRVTPRRADSLGEPNPLTGLVYCADCNRKMYNSRHSAESYQTTRNGKPYTSKTGDSYNCSTYSLGKSRFQDACSGHFIRTTVIRELVLDAIRNICGCVRNNQEDFVRQVREESSLQRVETVKSHKKSITKNERRIVELKNLFRKVYEDNANGKLSDKRFEEMSADYEKEQETLEFQNAEMQAELDTFNSDSEKVDSFIALVKKYTEFEELTTPMLNEFINRIVVYKADKNEWGERTQKVEIVFNIIGKFDVPIVEIELTPEEQEALEKRRIKLAKQREANARFRAKQKQNTA
jgi:DNA invertase Pin-like site-specific DNA recombinase